MKFSDITAAVHDAWQFCWPPLVACVVAYSVASFLYPVGVGRLAHTLSSAVAALGGRLAGARDAMQPFGLTTLVPFVSLVFVIAFLFLVNTAAMVWSSRLPPYISYQPDRLLFDRVSEKERLLLFRKYPTAEHFNTAYYMAVEEYRAKPPEHTSRTAGAENYYKMHNFIKFAVAVGVLALIVALRYREVSLLMMGKSILLVMACALLWAFALVGLLYEQEQDFHREWASVRSNLQAEAAKLLE